MEEKTNKQFEFTEEHYQFPRVIAVNYLKTDEDKFIRIIESPFNNCQTFSISRAYKLSELDKEEIICLFKEIYKRIRRKQFVIDLKDDCNDSVLESIKHIVLNKYSTPYVSTNQSNMNLHIIQLDINKLK